MYFQQGWWRCPRSQWRSLDHFVECFTESLIALGEPEGMEQSHAALKVLLLAAGAHEFAQTQLCRARQGVATSSAFATSVVPNNEIKRREVHPARVMAFSISR